LQADKRRHFVAALEKAHSRQLRRFLSVRLRPDGHVDIPDLIQEIYLRLLRLKDHGGIRNPQAYIFTIASHVLHQYTLQRANQPSSMDPLEVVKALQSVAVPDSSDELDIEQQVQILGEKLKTHSPRAYAVLIMYRCEGLTFREIGKRLGISSVMAHKYLARAILFCNQALDAPRRSDS